MMSTQHTHQRICEFLKKNVYSVETTLGIITALLLLTSNCAKVLPLEGGPIDTIPPKVIHTYPAHQSTGFKGRQLRLTFDKEVELQDVYNRLLITPKLPLRPDNEPSYTCKARAESVILDLEVPLEEATTYTFNFKNAIQDMREKTAAEDPTLTFSTGDYVDSMYIQGNVKHLMTDQPAEKAIVCLYKITDVDTVHILNAKPDYVEKTDKEGSFKLENLKQGTYRVCAGFSKEQGLILDPTRDPYGFIPAPIILQEPIDALDVAILHADITPFKVQTTQPHNQYFEINFSKPVVHYTLVLSHPSKRFKNTDLTSYLLADKTIIRIYNTLGLLEDDLVEAKLTARDEMGNTLEQLVSIHFDDKFGEKTPFKLTIKPDAHTPLKLPLFKVAVAFNKPIKNMLLNKLYCVVDVADTVYLKADEVTLHPLKDSLTIEKKFHLKPSYTSSSADSTQASKKIAITLHLEEGAFTSVEKEYNKALQQPYSFKKESECGTIKGTVKTNAPGFIIQLLNKNFEVVDEIRNQTTYAFKEVLPGSYKIRILVLPEKDGVWRFGDIYQLIPPDPVIFYPSDIGIIANWEVEDIDFEF
jgi:hypothetical protein